MSPYMSNHSDLTFHIGYLASVKVEDELVVSFCEG
jgi:hypothetical protein